jgi:CHAT domain-containing protein/tetratricopeptide (TPR) repeat protein
MCINLYWLSREDCRNLTNALLCGNAAYHAVSGFRGIRGGRGGLIIDHRPENTTPPLRSATGILLAMTAAMRDGRLSSPRPKSSARFTILAGSIALVLASASTAQQISPNAEPTQTDRAIGLIKAGHYAEAEPLLLRTLASRESAWGPNHVNVSHALYNLGWLYRLEGRYSASEPLVRRALLLQQDSLGKDSITIATTLNELGYLLVLQGRYIDAEPIFRRALAIQQRALGDGDPAIAITLDNIGYLYRLQDRYAEARSLYQRALVIRERTLGSENPLVALLLTNLGSIDRLQGNFAEAERLEQRALAIRVKTLGADHPDVADSYHDLGVLYLAERRFPESERALQQGIAIDLKALGPGHPLLATHGYNSLARLYTEAGQLNNALGASDHAAEIIERQLLLSSVQRSVASLTERRLYRKVFLDNIAAAYAARRSSGQDQVAHSFIAAQYASTSTAGQALASMAARFATGDNALASSIRRLQDLADQRQQLDEILLREASEPSSTHRARGGSALRLEAIDRDLTRFADKIAQDFPKYAEIANPKALPLDAIQKLLAPDEAMLVYVVGPETTWLWVVRNNTAQLHRIDISAAALQRDVSELRRFLDPDSNPSLSPFPAMRAYALYQRILAPAEQDIGGVHNLILVPDGAVQSLPIGVLVTARPLANPVRPADHRNIHWLARDRAVTVIPSVNSLRVLRAFAHTSHASLPFAGVGDPALGGGPQAGQSNSRGMISGLGQVEAQRVPVPRIQSSRSPDAIARTVDALPSLPETAVELRAIAVILGASTDDLFLGPRANRPTLERANLERYRIVEFATHGLRPGDLGLTESALVLTPPHQATAENDGLLTASQIATMHLDADWVVLSACNTAESDGTAVSDGFSGLAKAFFYAGARSVLISHWSVPSGPTVLLTAGAFAAMSKDPSIGRAEAIRRSMIAIQAPPYPPEYAHPLVWAPFSIAGEGGANAIRPK